MACLSIVRSRIFARFWHRNDFDEYVLEETQDQVFRVFDIVVLIIQQGTQSVTNTESADGLRTR